MTFADVFDKTHCANKEKGSYKDKKLEAIAISFGRLFSLYHIHILMS